MDEEFFTIPEVAKKLKVTRSAIYKWMKEGRLNYVLVGSERRVTSSDLAAFVRTNNRKEERDVESEIHSPALAVA